LERRHGVEAERLRTGLDLLDGLLGELHESGLARRAMAGDVQHEPAARAGLTVHGEPRELLEGVQDLTVTTDEMAQLTADDLDGGAIAVHVDVDVAVKIGDVQQLLEEISGDVAFALQIDVTHRGSPSRACSASAAQRRPCGAGRESA